MANVKQTIPLHPLRVGTPVVSFSLNVTHEPDPFNLQDETIRETFLLETQAPKTKVAVNSHVNFRPTHLPNSPAYLAAIRRQGAAQIKKRVLELERFSHTDEFTAWTQGVLVEVKQLLKKLADAEESRRPRSEANSCEILRQLRDTLLNDSWRNYRRPEVRRAACAALRTLNEADAVTAEDAFRTGEAFLDLEISPAAGAAICDWEEGEDAEEEISD